jgi:hypothetical protein
MPLALVKAANIGAEATWRHPEPAPVDNRSVAATGADPTNRLHAGAVAGGDQRAVDVFLLA